MINKKNIKKKKNYKFVQDLFENLLYRLIIIIVNRLPRLLINTNSSRDYLNALE